MFSTSFKIVIGYILLVGLLIGAFTYTMQQMNLLTTPTSLRDQLDHRRHITHRIISQLYDAGNHRADTPHRKAERVLSLPESDERSECFD